MESLGSGRDRIECLTFQRLRSRGLSGEAADAFARRARQTGLHPPLDEVEAHRIAGASAMEWARIYADEVGLRERLSWSCGSCQEDLPVRAEPCSYCGELAPRQERSWVPDNAGRLRLPDWMVFVHGMNTRGDWQEDLAWHLGLIATEPTPVKIHKYGRVWWVLPRSRLRRRAMEFAHELRRLARDAAERDRQGPPDVLAHSLGTWLVGHALRVDSELCLGRVALTGSILTPDFEWDELLASGRVEAVSSVRAGRDLEVSISQFGIPDSGPSGRVGFVSDQVIEWDEPQWRHSTCFEPSRMRTVLESFWRPFFTWDSRGLAALSSGTPRPSHWAPASFGRATSRVE